MTKDRAGLIAAISPSPVFQVLLRIPVIVFVRTDHDKLNILSRFAVGEEVLCVLKLEFVDEYAPQVAFFFIADGNIFHDCFYLRVQDVLFLFCELFNFLLERS